MRFQYYLKKQIIRMALISLSITFLLFYLLAYFFNQYSQKQRLYQNNIMVEKNLDDIYQSFSYSINELHNMHNSSIESIYPYFYKIRRHFNVNLDLLIYNAKNELIFGNSQDLIYNFKPYLSLLTQYFSKNNNFFTNLRINNENFLIYINIIGNKKYLFFLSESDIKSLLHSDLSLIITDKYHQVIYANQYDFIDHLNYFSLPTKSNFIFVSKIIKNNFICTTYIRKQNLLDMSYLAIILIFTGSFLTLFLHLYSKKISAKSVSSLNLLITEMEKIKNKKYDYIQSINTDDEFEDIAKEINKLLKNVHSLNEKNNELSALNKEIEMKQLESQFNPHFLYNTLETIRYCIYVDKQQAADLILKLTSILRYSINHQEEIVPLQRDISYIENYLQICKIRFQDRFTYMLKIQEECRNIHIPKLILQPIIENSIRHNFKTKSKLSIWITMEVVNKHLIIEVEDDGDGIKAEMMHELNQHNIHSVHIGLNNVYRRLQLHFDKNFQFNIYSHIGIGTKVSLSIPILKEVNNV